jgi:hypothetical protein
MHIHLEQCFGVFDQAADGGGRARIGAGGERDVAFAGEQAGGGVQANPAGAGQIDFGPGVQIGEIRASSPAT